MRLSFIFFTLFAFIQLKAQTTKYLAQYEYSFVQDSLRPSKVKSERMNLYLLKDKSVFISQKSVKRDSIYENEGNELKIPASGIISAKDLAYIPKPEIRYSVTKNKKEQQNIIKSHINSFDYEFSQAFDEFQWELKTDTLSVLGYLAHKAEVEIYGRKFTAWFTSEIPISDGPYKFQGLPGLIVKLNDSENYFNFELVGFQKIKDYKVWNEDSQKSKTIKTSEKEYRALIQKYQKDPMAYWEASTLSGMVADMDENEIKQKVNQMLKANNNFIEKNLILNLNF